MIANFLYEYHDSLFIVQFLADIILFVGVVYAMLSHKLPKYHEKPLYFVGFFALLSGFTIIATWVEGPIAGMSYSKIGVIPDTGMNVCLALVAAQLLWREFKEKSNKTVTRPTRVALAKRSATAKSPVKKRRK